MPRRKDPIETAPENKPARKDPPPRPTSAVNPWERLHSPDPERHYIKVPIAGQMNHEYYETVGAEGPDGEWEGYRVEKHMVGGVRFGAGKAGEPGTDMVQRGHVLMSISKVAKANMERYGDSVGGVGSEAANARIQRPARREAIRGLAHGLAGPRREISFHSDGMTELR